MQKKLSKQAFRSKCKNRDDNNRLRNKSLRFSLYHLTIYQLDTKHNRAHIKSIKKYNHSLSLISSINNLKLRFHRFNPSKLFNKTLPLCNLKWMYHSRYINKCKLQFTSYSHPTPISKSNNQISNSNNLMPNLHPKPINRGHLKTSNLPFKWINKLNNSPSSHLLNRTSNSQCNRNSQTNRLINYHHSNSLGNLIHHSKIHLLLSALCKGWNQRSAKTAFLK